MAAEILLCFTVILTQKNDIVKKNTHLCGKNTGMKIYDYNGKANICGTRIRMLRKQQKLSQEELAARLQVAGIDIDQRTISRIEREARFLADFELREIARILRTPIEELFGK